METLDGKAMEWYEGFNQGSLLSLKDFHKVFYEHYKEHSPSLSLVGNCCDQFEVFIQYIESIDEDLVDVKDEDLLEALYGFHSQINCHDN